MADKDNSQSRKWQLTLNGIDKIDNVVDLVKETLAKFSLDFYCFCQEIGNKTHNRHMHIFIFSKISPIRFITIKHRFESVGLKPHIEKAYSDIQTNIDYVKKTGKFENSEKSITSIEGTYEQYGTIPSELQEKDPIIGQLLEDIKDGLSNIEIIEKNPQFAFKIREIDTIRYNYLKEKTSKSFRKIRTYFCYGETSTGKSSFPYNHFPTKDIFRIYNYHNLNALWDGYDGEKVVLMDEFDGSIPIELMLILTDKFPITSGLSRRYNNAIPNFEYLFVATNRSYEEIYSYEKTMRPSTWKAFDRRWGNIWEFQKTPKNEYKIIKHRETKYEEELKNEKKDKKNIEEN